MEPLFAFDNSPKQWVVTIRKIEAEGDGCVLSEQEPSLRARSTGHRVTCDHTRSIRHTHRNVYTCRKCDSHTPS